MAGVVVDDDQRMLAIRRRDNGKWEPPGGVLELDESIEDCLVREVAEETGLEVRPVALTGVYKNMTRGIVALVFRCEIVQGEPAPTAEAVEVKWMTPDEIRESMAGAYAIRMLDASTGAPTSIRIHDGVELCP